MPSGCVTGDRRIEAKKFQNLFKQSLNGASGFCAIIAPRDRSR
jgi:hypothetical protein